MELISHKIKKSIFEEHLSITAYLLSSLKNTFKMKILIGKFKWIQDPFNTNTPSEFFSAEVELLINYLVIIVLKRNLAAWN